MQSDKIWEDLCVKERVLIDYEKVNNKTWSSVSNSTLSLDKTWFLSVQLEKGFIPRLYWKSPSQKSFKSKINLAPE